MKKFLGGSRAFFDGMVGFNPHDTDWNVVGDEYGTLSKARIICGNGEDIFFFPRMETEDLMDYLLNLGVNAKGIAMVLIPEVAREYGITIEHLKRLKGVRDIINRRHEYLGVIYDFYIQNGEMKLTEEQRMTAFEVYLKYRKNEKDK